MGNGIEYTQRISYKEFDEIHPHVYGLVYEGVELAIGVGQKSPVDHAAKMIELLSRKEQSYAWIRHIRSELTFRVNNDAHDTRPLAERKQSVLEWLDGMLKEYMDNLGYWGDECCNAIITDKHTKYGRHEIHCFRDMGQMYIEYCINAVEQAFKEEKNDGC